MTQDDLFAQSSPQTVIDIAWANASTLSAEFLQWLPENMHIWVAFEKQVLTVIARGFKHYSSRTILEFLRHHSAVSEVGGEWKINNNIQPYLPRLFDLVHPTKAGLFEYRVTTKEKGC